MTNQLVALLSQWQSQKLRTEWVLGTVYKTEGPCYRKAGAMMLFGGEGQQLGMLSGGCLESDIQKHARKVMDTGQSITITYDGSDEDDLSFQLGIGCGGTVHIVLQVVSQANDFQCLDDVLEKLTQREVCQYEVQLPCDGIADKHNRVIASIGLNQAVLIEEQPISTITIAIKPQPHLLVVGGGVDARPLVSMAAQLGWSVALYDPRPANARKQYFTGAAHILNGDTQSLKAFCVTHKVNAAVLMSHNIDLDAQGLTALYDNPLLQYMALLGPAKRQDDVFARAKLNQSDFNGVAISGPAGLRLGGELPESIALSILAECHAYFYGADAGSICDVLSR